MSESGSVSTTTGGGGPTTSTGSGSSSGSGLGSLSEDLTLPKATVQKILTEILPPEFAFTKDAKEALIECCVEFIMILSAESNEVAEKELKKTISSDHVVKALNDLGFENYLEQIDKVLKEHKELNSNKIAGRNKNKFQNSGLSEEELLRQQEELFAASRNKLQHTVSGNTPVSGGIGENIKREEGQQQ